MPVFFILTSTLITVAFLGGGIFPLTIAAVAAILSAACAIFFSRHTSAGPSNIPILAALLVLIVTSTVIPLPPALSSCFGSIRASQYAIAEQAITEAGVLGIAGADAVKPLFALSMNRAGTARMILLLIAGFSIAALSARLSAPWKDRYLRFLAVFATAIAAAGFISQWIIPQDKNIWWLFPVPHGMPVGCFINRNHFGGFAAMMCSPALFLASNSLVNKRLLSAIFWAACFAVLGAATLLSLSKGAWLSLSISLLFAFCALLAQKRLWHALLLPALLAVAVLAMVTTHSGQVSERFMKLPQILNSQSAQMRMSTWKDAITILRDYPFAGTGANAFRMVFPQYRTATTRKPFEHAENEYVQVPVEFGIPATVVIIAILLCAASRWRSNFRIEKDLTMSLCIAGMVITVAAHSFTDYAIRIPLYFLTAASMLGLAISTAPDNYQKTRIRAPLAMAFSSGMLVITIAISGLGEQVYQLDSPDCLKSSSANEICHALSWSPVCWQAWYRLGATAIVSGSDKSCRFGERCISRAATYDPNNYKLWEELARLRLSLQDLDGARDAHRRMKELRSWKQIKELEDFQPAAETR